MSDNPPGQWKEEDRLIDGTVQAIINSRPGKQPDSKLYSIKLEYSLLYHSFLRPQDLSKGRLLLEEANQKQQER